MSRTQVSVSFECNDLANNKIVCCAPFRTDDADENVDDVVNEESSYDETIKPAITKRPERCETIRIVSDKRLLISIWTNINKNPDFSDVG